MSPIRCRARRSASSYRNGHHETAPGPVTPGEVDGEEDRPREAGLAPHPQAQGFYDLGLNGSYMVVRELRQDVAAFWTSMDENAAAVRRRDPEGSAHVTADWIAERVVGRNRDGHLLCPGRKLLPPGPSGLPDNDYLFLERDPEGSSCPLGSHVRRANPRDALAQGLSLLGAANNHRILRRTLRVKTFVQMTGGDYFFLPSLPALDYLARL